MFFNFRLKNPRRNVALIRSKNNVALDDGKIAKKSRRRGSPERKTRKRPIRPHIRACYIIFRFCRFVKEGIRPFSPKFPKIFQKKQNFLARRRLSEKSSTKNATRLFPKSKTCQKSNNQRFGASGEKNFKKKSKTVKKSLQSRRGDVTIAYVNGGKIVFFDAFAPRGFFRRPSIDRSERRNLKRFFRLLRKNFLDSRNFDAFGNVIFIATALKSRSTFRLTSFAPF